MTDTDTQNLIADLLLKWEESFECGSEIPAEELCADSPELLNELEQKIKALKKMAWMNYETDEDSSNEFIGKVLNQRYEIKQLIGSGGFGAVFKSYDNDLERFVAIKIPHSHRINSNTDEAKVAAKFQTDGIVSVHDVGSDNGIDYIVSEMIEGLNLRCYANKNNLTWKQSVNLVSKVTTNLQKAHDVDLIHRDIKPENILVDSDGNPHITDFGITSTGSDFVDAQKGTLAYMSPEQIAGEARIVDQRSDVYSLGVVLFELQTGSLPYKGENSKLKEQILLAEPNFDSIEPEHLRGVCRKALAKHPDARFQSATELAEALNGCLSYQQPVNPVWKRRAYWGALVVSLIALGFLLGSIWQSTDWTALKDGEVFDGSKRIATDVDSFFPCTIEAWVAPSSEKEQWIVGSDVPTQYGIGLGIKSGGYPMVETIRGGMHSPDHRVPLHNKWSHLAAVFGEDETRLYLNGKLVGTCPATEAPSEPSKFVIGNLGEKHQTQYFTGRIRSVRISQGEIYDEVFEPSEEFGESENVVFCFPD